MNNQNQLNIVMAQLNFMVGDIEHNTDKIINAANTARDKFQADLIVFPELAITSYPPEDLLLRPGLYLRVENQLEKLCNTVKDIDIIVGFPEKVGDNRYNAAAYIREGKIIAKYYKHILPNYSVFDEQRYFVENEDPCVINIKGIPTAITICEDLWHPEPMRQAKNQGAKLMISINASPFDILKSNERLKIIGDRAKEGNMPIIYVNLIGGQDELIFDGGSIVLSEKGDVVYQAPFFEESLEKISISVDPVKIISQQSQPNQSNEERIYRALVLGVRDYIEKNKFPRAVIGLSGGIDSALTLCIAVDAIGADRVEAVMMPSRYTSELSHDVAKEQAEILEVEYNIIPIDTIFQTFLDELRDEFKGYSKDTTEENLQARCRGIILMAISNKKNAIVLSTGNKSELSVGYATLYGDMVGGFCMLKDISKTWVYKLADYRNSIKRVIPQRVIDRPPTAELAPNQLDADALPPYHLLDAILERYVEKDQSLQEIIAAGFESDMVHKVAKMVNRNEYKRRQAPVGVRISQKAFGRDRRYPITSAYYRDLPKE